MMDAHQDTAWPADRVGKPFLLGEIPAIGESHRDAVLGVPERNAEEILLASDPDAL